MKNMSALKKPVAVVAMAVMTFACGSSEEDPPPPMVDCNASGPEVTLGTTSSTCGEDDGEIAVSIAGGTGNLTVTLSPQPIGANFANNTFTNVQPGSYTVEVTDANNCTASATATIDFDAGNISYQSTIDPIIQANCAVSGCHVANNPLGVPDFTDFAMFQARANNNVGGVRQRVKSNDMPRSTGNPNNPGTPLTDEQKAAIFCWIDEGSQNN